MLRCAKSRWLAAISSLTIASIRLSTIPISITTPNRGANLLKEPVTPIKTTISSNPVSTVETEHIYNNEESPTRYSMEPPIAKQKATYTILPWDTTVDNYAWLRDAKSEETLSYLKAENAYTKYTMKHTETLQKVLYKEILTRIVEDDSSVPAKRDNYLYYKRTESKKPYNIHCRKHLTQGDEEILLDVNALAEGKEFMKIGSLEVSPNHQILAYSTDEQGNEYYDLVFKDLNTGELLTDRIDSIGRMEWCNDNQTIYYIKYNEAWRPYQLWRHKLGENVDNDELIYQEDDVRFRISISRTRDDKYMILHIGSAITDEVHYIDANDPYNNAFECIAQRVNGIEYSVDHHENEFLILMNDDAINFQLYAVNDDDATDRNQWKKAIDHDEDITLRSVSCFKDFIVINQRRNGLPEYRIRYKSADNEDGEHIIELPETSYDIWSSQNLEYVTDKFRFDYTSLVTPTTTYDYDVNTQALDTLKVRPVDEYDASNYQTKRIWATGIDGTPIPMSLIARKDVDLEGWFGPVPVHLIGYGSYGSSYDVYFSAARLSLVDRGIVVGYAHIRGGGEFGRKWKLDGKLDKKMNTFQDFIACSQELIDTNITDNKHLVCSGGSAGGLLMGAIMNMRADLYHAIVADVPFVDVLNTILDETIPLTAGEWEEWGDPRTMDDYFRIKGYSPYDNISTQRYPNMLLEGGLNDTRVKYWEPAKFAAKLRENKRNYKHLYDENDGENTILLKTNMGAGHGGASGRYGRIKEVAFEYAFLLDQLGMIDVQNPNLKVILDDDDEKQNK